MRSPIKDYTIAAEHYLEKVVHAHRSAEKAKAKNTRR